MVFESVARNICPEGLTHDEVIEICRQMGRELLDFVHLTDGCYEALKYMFPDEDGTMLKYAESLKKVVKIPVHNTFNP